MDNNFDSLLNLLSIVLGYQNLIENRQQSQDNDIAKNNQEQAKHILNDLHQQFDKQNKMLEEILSILKGEIK